MPKELLGRTPYKLIKIDTDEPVTTQQIYDLLTDEGISLCVRSKNGDVNRGGYFFHMQKADIALQYVNFYTFEGLLVSTLSMEEAVKFINHVSGLLFDNEMFVLCQNDINLRQDQ